MPFHTQSRGASFRAPTCAGGQLLHYLRHPLAHGAAEAERALEEGLQQLVGAVEHEAARGQQLQGRQVGRTCALERGFWLRRLAAAAGAEAAAVQLLPNRM